MPADPADRAAARLWIWDFDRRLRRRLLRGAARRGAARASDSPRRLAALDMWLEGRRFLAGGAYGLADIAYVPWILRAQQLLGCRPRSVRFLPAFFSTSTIVNATAIP